MTFRLPRLPRSVQITDSDGGPSIDFQRWFQSAMIQIETSLNAVQDALDAAAVADAAAAAADAAAVTANTAATNVTSAQNLIDSYVTGITITATDAGSDATINISAHTRVYADGTSVSVNSGSLTGLSYSTLYYIYYDDADRAGGAVTYVATATDTDAVQTGNRHVVGSVTTPAAAAPDETGGYVRAPGTRDILTSI